MPDLKKQTISEPYTSTPRTEDAMIAETEESMAANPAFEADAMKFEKKLGALAYGHGISNGVVNDASQKILKYIDERAEGIDKAKRMAEMLEKTGGDNKKYSGVVGVDAAKIKKVFESGALGERCNHIEGFYRSVLLPDLLAPTPGLDDALKEAEFNSKKLKERTDGKTSAYQTYDQHAEGTALGDQWRTRQKRDEAKKQGVDRPLESPTLGEIETAGPVVGGTEQPGVKLSEDEKALQGVSKPEDQTAWVSGQGTWVMNEANKWVQAQRAASLPLVAGPSGTTDRLMQTFEGLGVGNPSSRRLACIGYLLPPSHHSLVEVLTGAEPHGVGFTPGQKMYMNIRPLTTEELKACGDGKYPHQRHPE